MDEKERGPGALRTDRHQGLAADRARAAAQLGGQPLDRRPLHQRGQRERPAAALADAGDQAHPQERMPAEREEVVPDADRGDAQQLLPDAGELELQGVARRDPLSAPFGPAPIGSPESERPAVDLAVRGERQGVEEDERRGDHGLRERRLQRGAQLRGSGVP